MLRKSTTSIICSPLHSACNNFLLAVGTFKFWAAPQFLADLHNDNYLAILVSIVS